MLLTLLYLTFYGILGIACVAITPNLMMAAILSGAFYGLMNLFAGFVITKPNFPGWWIWVSTACIQLLVTCIRCISIQCIHNLSVHTRVQLLRTNQLLVMCTRSTHNVCIS